MAATHPMVTAMVGRDHELRRVLAVASGDGPAALFVVGEAGIGKTRLLAEASAAARTGGVAVLTAGASAMVSTPFGLLAEAVRSYARHHPLTVDTRLEPFLAGVRLFLPELGGSTHHGLDDGQLRLLALEGVVQLLLDLAENSGRVVVVLDDLQHADPDSIEALRYLVDARREEVRVIGALRTGEASETDSTIARLVRSGAAQRLELLPLTRAAVQSMISALVDEPSSEDFVDDIFRRTDGVPLLVEELSVHAAAETTIPPSIAESVRDRLARLEQSDRRVVTAAAVLDSFDPPLLAAVAQAETVAPAISAAVAVGLLHHDDRTVAFRHGLIREAVISVANPVDVWTIHRRAADELGRRPDLDLSAREQRAHHLREIAEHEEASRVLADVAVAKLADHAVLGAEASARGALEAARSPATRDAANAVLAQVLVAQGRWAEALAIDESAGDRDESRLVRMAGCALEGGRYELAEACIAEASAAAPESVAVLVLRGRLALLTGDAEQALDAANRALDAAGTAPDQCAALDLVARALDFAGDRTKAVAAYRRLVRAATSSELVGWRIRGLVELGSFEMLNGQPPQSLLSARDTARDAGALNEWAWSEFNLSTALSLQGDLRRGMAVAVDAIEQLGHLRIGVVPFLALNRAVAAALLGDGQAASLFSEAETLAPDNVQFAIVADAMRGYVAIHEGRYADALAAADASVARYRSVPGALPMDTPFWRVLALCALGRYDEARADLADVRSWPGFDRWPPRRFLLDAAEAIVAKDADRLDAAVDSVPGRQPLDIALARVIGAQSIGGSQAAEWLRAALDYYDEAGLGPKVTDRVRRLLRQVGAAVPRRKRPATTLPAVLSNKGITAREADVLRLAADGSPNAVIAQRLYLSIRTVESHISSLLRKLGVDNRNQLVAAAAVLVRDQRSSPTDD